MGIVLKSVTDFIILNYILAFLTLSYGFVDAFDTEQLVECVSKLKSGQSVQVPIYDFKKHQRCTDKSRPVVFSDLLSKLIFSFVPAI